MTTQAKNYHFKKVTRTKVKRMMSARYYKEQTSRMFFNNFRENKIFRKCFLSKL